MNETRRFGSVQVLAGSNKGAYPYGNSLLIEGSSETLLVDPSLEVAWLENPPPADCVFVSHAHEDHLAGLARYDSAHVTVHQDDLRHVQSAELRLERYGMPPQIARNHERELSAKFRLADSVDAVGVPDLATMDLGGTTVTVIHLPGHTRGHSGLLVEPDGFLFLADIDLSSFGPYYGDIDSDLEAFEASIARCRDIDARWYGTFHHHGVVEGVDNFRARLDAYLAVVGRRDELILAALSEPRTIEDILETRLLYPPHINEPYVPAIERRTTERHLSRLISRGHVDEVEPNLFRIT
ncbi:MBL fold metallo-hydrolase [Rhodococcus opacus]|nr:MBL fold metallo-hydrolase [Rhodococcus opacus]